MTLTSLASLLAALAAGLAVFGSGFFVVVTVVFDCADTVLSVTFAVALAGAVVTIISYIIHVHYQQGLPDEVEKAMMTIVEALFAFGAHRLTSN